MTATRFSESVVEEAALAWLESGGWRILHGPEIAPDTPNSQRVAYGDVYLSERLRDTIARLNPTLPPEAHDDAIRKLTRPEGVDIVVRNRAFHRLLVDGVTVEYRGEDGTIRGAQTRVLDFDNPGANDWLAVNQFTISENKHCRRLDIILFVNGLPLVLFELKNAAQENTSVWSALNQFQTYKNELPSLFTLNELLIISDGVHARVGTLTGSREWFKPWRTMGGGDGSDENAPELQVAVNGLLSPPRLLDMLRDFILFEDDGGGRITKKMAGYHQYHAVKVAVTETLRAAALLREVDSISQLTARSRAGDRRVGVIWHTQGSGKSLTMAFYAGRIVREPEMENPTIVVLTDRNDLDDQLFGTFSRCRELLRQPPVQAESRAELRELLSVEAGGVVFTTIHKFFPEERGDRHPCLSERLNIVVMADEAHRSQYDFIDGYARHMRDALPNASFIGFTGTPIELQDANTRAVFGDYISVYDIQRAVSDGATVPIYYESRLASLALVEDERPHIDRAFEEVTEGEEVERKERLKTRWAQLEAVVGTERRLGLLAHDIVKHFESRLEVLDGKGMVVCMSRRICVELYDEIVSIRPQWHADEDEQGSIKVVITGSATDPVEWQAHIRNKGRREALAKRLRAPSDPLRLVLVRDMWLTGFDAPSLHTMYIDKPMRGHGLMQAIARVNRVFRDKPGGLVVDYLGLAHELREALATYTESGGRGRTALDQNEAVSAMIERYEVCSGLLGAYTSRGSRVPAFDWSLWSTGVATQRLALLPAAQEHILGQDNGKERFIRSVRELSQAFALAVPHAETTRIRDDVAFFQAVQAVLAKRAPGEARPEEELDHAVRQIIARAVAPDGVVDIFAAAGLAKPDVSILSDEFLAEVRDMPRRNLAVELLQKLLSGEVKARSRKNVVQARSFADMLEHTLKRYQNRAIEAAQVLEELIHLAKEMRAATARGEALGLNDDELAFYEALEVNDSAVQVLGDDTLRTIAREVLDAVRRNVTIDWTARESVRAQLRVMVKRILRKYGYPPDKQEKATQTVLEQAETFTAEWVAL